MTRRTPPKPDVYAVKSDAGYIPRCPKCNMPLSLVATVAVFGEPASWEFYGRKGERGTACRGEQNGRAFVHFAVLFDGKRNERLAWIAPDKEDADEETQPVLLKDDSRWVLDPQYKWQNEENLWK